MRSTWRVVRDAYADEADGLGRITKALRLADLFTMANAVTGLVGVLLAALGHVDVAAALVVLAVILDGVDGIAARRYGGGPLGPFLDSLADLMSFGVLPAVLLATAFPDLRLWAVPLGALFLVCAMLRLARFEVLREDRTLRYYSGMTTTSAGILVAATILAGLPAPVVLAWTVVLSLWMVSRVRTVKLTMWPLVFAAIVLFPVFLRPLLAPWVALPQAPILAALLAGMVVYAFLGPFYILGRFGPVHAPEGGDA